VQGACETTQRKLRGTKTKEWFVRLGFQCIGDLAEPGTTGRAPRVNNIRAIRKRFRDATAKTQQQTEADQPREEESKEDDETEEEGAHSDPFENDLVLLRVRRLLLPLLMKEEMLNKAFWAADIGSAAVESALDSMARESRQHREDSLSAVLQTVQAPTSPNTKENPNVLPMLKKHGVSPEDRRVHENLLRDLRVLNKKYSKSNTLHCMIQDNFTSAFVRVPSSKGLVRMKKNANETEWLPDVLTALGGPGNNHKSLLDLLTCIAQNEDCKAT
jgi:hypothetical protein